MKIHKSISNEVIEENLDAYSTATLKFNIDECLDEVSMTLRELSLLTGIRYATLIDLKKGRRVNINMPQMLSIMITLKIDDFGKLFKFHIEDDQEREDFREKAEYIRKYEMPEEVFDKIPENARRLGRENEVKHKK
ncbi:hypothetical protein [Halobacillus karajensis]|uniref:hypothetical protein n=1 Tax=Halobacillus karajensis TaxID=195088 RepID=UPI00045C3307|nr:hypothetical protein [Halobacillus karajensis]CDQ21748.1 hypothetical protein BN982_04157 [Halobacillus karajensis]